MYILYDHIYSDLTYLVFGLKLCIFMSLSILFDNYSHHIDIHHLHGLLHCEYLNFVLM